MFDGMSTEGVDDVAQPDDTTTPFDDYGGYDPNSYPVSGDDLSAEYQEYSASNNVASPFEAELNEEHDNEDENQRNELDEAVFASADDNGSTPVLPPPSQMEPEEGAAFREWRRSVSLFLSLHDYVFRFAKKLHLLLHPILCNSFTVVWMVLFI